MENKPLDLTKWEPKVMMIDMNRVSQLDISFDPIKGGTYMYLKYLEEKEPNN